MAIQRNFAGELSRFGTRDGCVPFPNAPTERSGVDNDIHSGRAHASTIQALFRAQVARTPHAIAVRHGADTLSYRALDTGSDALAAMLRQRGLTRGGRVVVSMFHDVNVAVAFLGVLKCGASYVPVDPEAPRALCSALLSSTEPTFALCDARTARKWSEVALCLVVDELRLGAAWYPYGAVAPATDNTRDDVAYSLYTAGSQVLSSPRTLSHRELTKRSIAFGVRHDLRPGERVLCSTSIDSDGFGEQLYAALSRGAEAVLGPAMSFA